MSNAAQAVAQDELLLLEKVLMRLASADTDEALTAAVNKFLTPCLLKLTSPQEGVRKKVMELLVHINKRIKNNPKIFLPLDALLVQYQDPSATSFVTNFTIIYIKMGFPRLSADKQAELIPAVLNSIEAKPSSHQESILLMIIPVFDSICAPENPEKKKLFLGLNEKPQVNQFLNSFLLDYLLLPYGLHPSLNIAEDPTEPAGASAARIHPCLSEAAWKRAAGETPVKAEELEKNKVKVLKFLGMGFLEEMEIAMHLIVGTADTRHSVASQAESEIRKLSGILDWNDPGIVSKIYSLFLGTLVIKEKPPPKPENKRVPANTRIRLKLMPYLLKSREAAVQFPACIQVIFDLLFGTTGNTNAKLKLMAVSFIHHVIFHCPSQRLGAIGAVLLSALTRLVTEEKDNPKLRASCYVAIGKLGLKAPQLVNRDVTMIQTFFEAMAKEDKETQLSVQEAMSLMAPSFKQMEKGNLSFVEALLATYIENDEPQVRLVAIQYAGEIFSQTHEASRYILLLGSGDTKEEVANQAKSHLYKALNKMRQQSESRFKKPKEDELVNRDEVLPGFVTMLKYVLDKADVRVKTQDRYIVGDKTLAFNPSIYVEVLNFLRTCLIYSSEILPTGDALSQPMIGAPAVTKFLNLIQTHGQAEKTLVMKYLEFTENFLSALVGAPQANAMLQIIGCTMKTTATKFAGRINWFKGLLDNTKEEIRETIAQIFSIVAAEMNDKDFERAITDLTRGFKEKSLEFQHGIIITLGYSFGRKVLYLRMTDLKKDFMDWDSYKIGTELILTQLHNPHQLILGAACSAISELGRCGPLPLMASADVVDTTTTTNKLGLVIKLLSLLKNGKTAMRVREKAALALGQLCIGDVAFPHRKLVLKEFLESAQEIKDIELHFTMGEALVYATMGSLSPMSRDIWNISEDDFKPMTGPETSDEFIDFVLDELCNKYTMSAHPNVKQASCLWLLAITKYGKDLPKLKMRLLEIQSAFMSLLGDNNDLVQDAASKGLGLVYDCSSEKQQEEMVDSLLRTLTDGKREVQKVTEETKIFEEGQIGKAPTGENLSTYKELCSLATDLNQPDLVYKFMHLANYNAMWNSRKGAAFGFSSIATKAGEQMEPYLPKIVPKLYRYQFDPTPKIQESMMSIWNSLIPETTKTVDKYLSEILEEININLTSSQWRVRESCCMALQDLLRGRTLDDALEKVPALWINTFRVMDDIKESVRIAAGKAANTLSRTCIKMCDLNQGAKSSDAAVKAIMQPLLENGLQSAVPDVRVIVINTIVKVTKNAGGQLKPHLSMLIPALLEATSEMEGKDLNYLSVRMANDPSIQEKLDLARITAAKGSPMMECINYVLQYVDTETLEKLVPRLVDLIKGNFGIGTKGTAAHLITTLTHQCPLDLQAYTGKILAAFVSGLTDRNAAVRKTYASAIGHLMKTAKDSSLEKLFVKLRTWYLEKDEAASRLAVAYTFEAINLHNPDKIKCHAGQALPLAFLAMHEEKIVGEDDEILGIWEEVWSDGTPGTEGGIRIYLKEIMSLLTVAIDSQQWKMKAQAARAMGKIASRLGETIPQREQEKILAILINSLGGRTWDGKESMLAALADVCTSGKAGIAIILKEGNMVETLSSCLFRECKKEKHEYRIAAIQASGKIVQVLELKCFDQLFELIFPVIRKDDKEAEGKEDELDREDNVRALDLHHAIYECLGLSWPRDQDMQKTYLLPLLTTLRHRVQSTTRKNQLCIIKCLNNIISVSGIPLEKNEREAIFVEVAKILSSVLVIPKSTQLRTEALSVLDRVIKLLVECQSPELVYLFRDEIAKSLDDVIKDVSSDAATKAMARELKTSLLAIPAAEPIGSVEIN